MSAERWRTLIACVAALAVGGTVSLFTAGPALFADGAFAGRPPVAAISIVLFAAVGLGLGALAPHGWKPVAITLAIAAQPVVWLLGRDTFWQLPMALLSAGFAIGDAAAGVFGVWAGARLRLRQRG